MIGCIVIFLIAYLFIATEWVEKAVAALLGASAVIMLHYIPYSVALQKIDLNVIFLLIGMMMIVNLLMDTGVFEWISIKLARLARGNGIMIMLSFLFATAFLSAFLDNVTTVILVAPVTILITQILEIPTVPILILEAVFSNLGGTATLIGDPPNILIGSATTFSFNDFLFNLAPIILIIVLIFLGIIFVVFRKKTNTRESARNRILRSHPEAAILQPVVLKRALVVFALVLAGFFLGRMVNIEPGIVALSGAFLMVLVCRVDLHKILANVEWNTIMFFFGLFIMIGALEYSGVFEQMGTLMLKMSGGQLLMTTMTILWFSAIASAIVDNIPLVMAMIPLVKSIVPVFAVQMGLTDMPELIHVQIEAPLYWALALGACLGGNGTLVGASANVVISQIAKRNGYHMSFWRFTKYGLPFMFMSLILCTAYLYLRYFQA
jgi:Na+/H+ antiporter NhaD/arsenite permease-like protein